MICAPVRSIIPSLKLGDYLSVQAHKPCSISHLKRPVTRFLKSHCYLFDSENILIAYFNKQSTLVISKSKGPSKTVQDIRTSTYQICSIEEKTI